MSGNGFDSHRALPPPPLGTARWYYARCIHRSEVALTAPLLFVVVQLVFLEGILSLDNAAVLGAMVAPLPADVPIPWPAWLLPVGRRLDRVLGMQRDAALKVGLLGAYVGRGMMLALATFVVQNPWLRLLGGLYLLYLALSYFGQLGAAGGDTDAAQQRGTAGGFWSVVLAVELADLAFSLDNVVAAVSLSNEYWVVLLGVAIGILLMRFAATIFGRLITWEPKLETAAYLLILAISVELILDDLFGIRFEPLQLGSIALPPEAQQFAITLLILLATLLLARVRWLRPVNRIWPPILRILALLRVPLHWLTWPLRAIGAALSTRTQA